MMNTPEVEYITTATGYSMLSGSMVPNNVFMFGSLVDWSEREYTAKEIVQRLNMQLAMKIKGYQRYTRIFRH